MARTFFVKFLTVFCLISLGLFLSCASAPSGDESVDEDASSDSQDAASDESDSDTTDTADVADSTDATETTDAEPSTSTSSTTTPTSEETSTTSEASTTSESSTTSETGETPTPTATACSFLETYSTSASGTNIGGGLSSSYEPSDVLWHTVLDQLFLVSDEGWISRMEADGSDITSWYIGGDLEGITVVDPDSDFIYIGVENPDGIAEFNLDTSLVTRTFTLTTWMTGADNQGLEALTFVPDESQTEGGLFYAGHQGEGSIHVFELPIATSTTSTSVTYVTSFTPVSGRGDIAGLSYNSTDDLIYVAYDGADKLRAIETDGTFVEEWELPGNDQEGLAIDEDCRLYITEDDATHDVWRYDL